MYELIGQAKVDTYANDMQISLLMSCLKISMKSLLKPFIKMMSRILKILIKILARSLKPSCSSNIAEGKYECGQIAVRGVNAQPPMEKQHLNHMLLLF